MKKTVIFYLTFKGNKCFGNKSLLKEYSFFTRKSKIVKDYFEWAALELDETNKETGEKCATIDIKIIGL